MQGLNEVRARCLKTPRLHSGVIPPDQTTSFRRGHDSIDPEDTEARAEAMRRMFASVGTDSYIETPFYANWAGLRVHLGERVYINFLCVMVDDGHIWIGDRTMIGPRVTISTGTHPLDPALRAEGLQYNRDVHIGKDVWIGAGAVINPGVTRGDGSVIGAGSVVTRDIPPFSVAYGVPARVVRSVKEGAEI